MMEKGDDEWLAVNRESIEMVKIDLAFLCGHEW